MKRLIPLLLIIFLCGSFGRLVIEEYSVIKVIGGIKHAKNKKALFTGDKVLSNEKLTFESQQSKAALVNKVKGRMMLQASKSGTVSEGLMPALSNVSSRAGALINAVDLKNHFADRYLILSDCAVEISPKSYPMDDEHFFFLRFDFKGESVSKKLAFSDNKLMLIVEDILKIDGKTIQLPEGAKAELVYRDAANKTSETLAWFEPIFTDETALAKECQLILKEFSELDAESRRNQLLAYLTENYGKPNQENFNRWTNTKLGI